MTTKKLTPSFFLTLNITVSAISRECKLRSFITGSDVFGISTTCCLPGLWLPGGTAIHTLVPTLSCFATLSDPLFIQGRRFIQSYGWWYHILLSTTALMATSCRTGSKRKPQKFLIAQFLCICNPGNFYFWPITNK